MTAPQKTTQPKPGKDPFDLASYPPAPREPRWGACLARRWVLGLVGGLMLFDGVLFAAILWAVSGVGRPFDDAALDSGPSTTDGVVVDARLTTDPGEDWIYEVEYRFEVAARSVVGRCFVERELQPGDAVRIEFLPSEPAVSRIEGGFLTREASPVFWILMLLAAPGFVMFVVWLRGAVQMRLVLREGRLVAAELLEHGVIFGVNPPQLRLRYRFRDEAGREVEGRSATRRRGKLGEAVVRDQPGHVVVVHDTGEPELHRAVHPDDFLPTTRGPGA